MDHAIPSYAPGRRSTTASRGISWTEFAIVLLVVLPKATPKAVTYALCLYLLVLAAIVWLGSSEKFDRNLLKAIGPIAGIIVIGLVSGVASDKFLYLKDAWYVSSPLVVICTGYVLFRCNPDIAAGLRAFVIAGTLMGMVHLATFVLHPELLRMDTASLRTEIGFGPTVAALSFSILVAYWGRWREGLRMPMPFALGCMAICLLAIAFGFSRVMLVIAVIGTLAAAGWFARREWLRIGVIAVLGIAAIVCVRAVVDPDNPNTQGTLLGKIARLPEELSIRDYRDRYVIQAHWRGYETSRALLAYTHGSPIKLLLGRGFGTQVDLGLFVDLATGESGPRVPTHFAPILHNGFAYLLVKAGPIAIGLFLYTLGWLYLVGRRKALSAVGGTLSPAARILQGFAIVTLLQTWISMGGITASPFLFAGGFILAALTLPSKDPT